MLLVMNKLKFEQKVLPLLMFFATELMLLVTLNFGNFGLYLRIIAFLITALLIPVFWKKLELDLANGLFMLLAPLLIYGLVIMLSPAYGTNSQYAESLIFMQRSPFQLVVNVLGVVAFLLLGYFVNLTKIIKREHALVSLFAGVALMLFISLIATIFNYGFFHTLKYAGKVIFYNGIAYNVSNQASLLIGFNIATVNVNVLINLALFLSSLAIGLIFFDKKMSKLLFISLIVAGSLGVLTLFVLAAFKPILFLIPSLAVALLFKFKLQNHKAVKISVYALVGLFAFGVLIFTLIAFNVLNLQTFLASNSFTRRLFLNGYLNKFYLTFTELLNFSFPFGNPYVFSENSIVVFPTGNIIFDSMRIDGLFGVILLLAVIFFIGKTVVNFVRNNDEHQGLTFALVSFVITLFIRYMFHYPFQMYIFTKDYWSINYFPLIEDSIFALVLFMTGLIFTIKSEGVSTNETK